MSTSIKGVGLGFRMNFSKKLIDLRSSEVNWIEIHPENYMCRGGQYPERLKKAMEHWPVVTHGLTMSFGSLERHEKKYLQDLKTFLRDVQTPWHSDHLCFGGVQGAQTFDLLPIPFDDESAKVVIDRIKEAQDVLQIPIAIENVSYYASGFGDDPSSEADFIVHVLEETGARMLLDVNNVFVNAQNHGFDPHAYIQKIPSERVVQLHIAGHLVREDKLRIDTHGAPVCKDVFNLLRFTIQTLGEKPLLLERDNHFPPLEELLVEVKALAFIIDDYRNVDQVKEIEQKNMREISYE